MQSGHAFNNRRAVSKPSGALACCGAAPVQVGGIDHLQQLLVPGPKTGSWAARGANLVQPHLHRLQLVPQLLLATWCGVVEQLASGDGRGLGSLTGAASSSWSSCGARIEDQVLGRPEQISPFSCWVITAECQLQRFLDRPWPM